MFLNPNAKILLKGRTLEEFPLKSRTKNQNDSGLHEIEICFSVMHQFQVGNVRLVL